MHRWTDVSQVTPGYGPSAVTLGNFDGVHRGHQAVLGRTVRAARSIEGSSVAITFDPHPAQVHRPDSAPPLLTGLTDRLVLMAQTGLDAALVLPYTLALARSTPEEFVRTHLVEALRARVVVVGHDVRFGRDNAGDLTTMIELGRRFGFEVDVVEDVRDAADPDRWSSTRVRRLLTAGDVRGAAEVLGRPHRVRGTVVRGDGRGRGLGFPTANLGGTSGMVPADGVYAGHLLRPGRPDLPSDERRLPTAVSIGTNPTFDGVDRRVEAYVLDRTDLDLYGEEVVVEVVELLRPTVRFDSVEALVEQMHRDAAAAHQALGREERTGSTAAGW